MEFQFQNRKRIYLILYKLLADFLFLWLLFLTSSFLAESVLPGIISSHFSFTRSFLILFVTITTLFILGNILEIKIEKKSISKKTKFIAIFFSSFLIFNSLFKLNLELNFAILFLSLATIFFLFKVLFAKDKS